MLLAWVHLVFFSIAVFVEGDMADAWFIILRGSVNIIQGEVCLIVAMQPFVRYIFPC